MSYPKRLTHNFTIRDLNIGDTVKLYCNNVELLKVDEEVKFPLLKV